jgi:hypothetical protein
VHVLNGVGGRDGPLSIPDPATATALGLISSFEDASSSSSLFALSSSRSPSCHREASVPLNSTSLKLIDTNVDTAGRE